MRHLLFILAFLSICGTRLAAQQISKSESLVQFSGMVLTEENGQLIPVPYVNIYLKNRARGTYSDLKGFFSFVAAKGDKIVFSAVGLRTVEKTIPDTIQSDHYSLIQLMSKDDIHLPELVIFPWPSREHFKTEFLAMNIHDELQRRAMDNLSGVKMEEMRKQLPHDGRENATFYLREQAKQNYYVGQFRPMNIFSPLAWKDFFDAWKSGKFKSKE